MLTAFYLAALSSPVQAPPPNAIVLFDGKHASAWVHRRTEEPCKWDIVDGALVVKAGTPDLMTKQSFGDYRFHMEFWLPLEADKKDQARANSGVYHHGRYEIQILDSWNNPTYATGGCGAIYGQKDPDKDAIKPPENWNSYDVLMRGARLDKAGNLLSKPRITVWHNGIKIHDDVEIAKPGTTASLEGRGWVERGPILLQNHGSAVRFRNIWIVEL